MPANRLRPDPSEWIVNSVSSECIDMADQGNKWKRIKRPLLQEINSTFPKKSDQAYPRDRSKYF